MKVRRARLADRAALAALSTQLGYPATAREIHARLQLIARRPDHLVAAAEAADGQVTGWIHAFLRRSLEMDVTAEIGGLVVDEEARSKGVGKALLGFAEKWARRERCRWVTVRSNVVRAAAHAFYERLGYETLKTQRVFRKPLR